MTLVKKNSEKVELFENINKKRFCVSSSVGAKNLAGKFPGQKTSARGISRPEKIWPGNNWRVKVRPDLFGLRGNAASGGKSSRQIASLKNNDKKVCF